MKYITAEIAQKIADQIMETVPYNINIMDQEGVILASGDRSRIGTIHQGAVKALNMKKAFIVYADTETERKGINLPIIYNDDIEGVIGISGDVDAVMPIGQIVVTTAQLMIENAVYNDISTIKENRHNDFLYEWTNRDVKRYTEKFLSQAEYYKVNLYLPRVAAYIRMKRVRYSVIDQLRNNLSPKDHIVRQSLDSVMILYEQDEHTPRRIQKVLDISEDFEQCFVGDVCTIASKAVESMKQVRQIAQILEKKERLIYYEDVKAECLLADAPISYSMEQLMKTFQEKDQEDNLKRTIIAYVEHSEDNKKVCEELYVHRNTLNYRLEKIYEYTGLNPRRGKDLMYLYAVVLKLMRIHFDEGKEREKLQSKGQDKLYKSTN